MAGRQHLVAAGEQNSRRVVRNRSLRIVTPHVTTAQPSTALLTDHYELTMVAAALRDGTAARPCVFEVFARRLPPGRRYGVVAGVGTAGHGAGGVPVRRCGDRLSPSAGVVDDDAAAWLADYRFTGDIDGYAEGELFFPGSPILTVSGTFAECVVLETLVLSILNHDCAVAAAAARMVTAARGRPLIEMGGRRTHEEAAVAAARAAYLAGFAYTSNLEAGRRYAIPTTGTAAHAYTLLHDDEPAAFASQVAALGKQTTLLVDTYDISQGIRNAIEVAGPGLRAIRIDSGDLSVLAAQSRQLLDSLGAVDTKIVVSGDLDEYAIAALAAEPVDVYGAGTSVVTGSGAPTAGLVYKLVEVEGRPVVKRSENKATVGGRKTAVRRHKPTGTATEEIVVSMGCPPPQPHDRGLQRPFVRGGEAVPDRPSLADVARAPAAVPDLDPVGGTQALRGGPGGTGPSSRERHDPRTDHRGRAERLLRGGVAGRHGRRGGRRGDLPPGSDARPGTTSSRRRTITSIPGRTSRMRPTSRSPGRRTASPAPRAPSFTPPSTPTGSRPSSRRVSARRRTRASRATPAVSASPPGCGCVTSTRWTSPASPPTTVYGRRRSTRRGRASPPGCCSTSPPAWPRKPPPPRWNSERPASPCVGVRGAVDQGVTLVIRYRPRELLLDRRVLAARQGRSVVGGDLLELAA